MNRTILVIGFLCLIVPCVQGIPPNKADLIPKISTPPTIDGYLNESCWQTAQDLSFSLTYWPGDAWYPLKPPREVLNGTLAIVYDDTALYTGIQLFNLTSQVFLKTYWDDNVTEYGSEWGDHRGASHWMDNDWSHIRAGEMWRYEITSWKSETHHPANAAIYPTSNLSQYIQWLWTNRTHTPLIDITYSLEIMCRFRTSTESPPWLLERVPRYWLHLLLIVTKPNEYEGTYVAPIGTQPITYWVAVPEANITHWYEANTTFPPYTPPTTPTTPGHLLALLLWAIPLGVTVSTLAIALYFVRRRQSNQPEREV